MGKLCLGGHDEPTTRGLREEDLTAEDLRIMQTVEPCAVWRTLPGFREPHRVKLLVAIALGDPRETIESEEAGEQYKAWANVGEKTKPMPCLRWTSSTVEPSYRSGGFRQLQRCGTRRRKVKSLTPKQEEVEMERVRAQIAPADTGDPSHLRHEVVLQKLWTRGNIAHTSAKRRENDTDQNANVN